MQVSFGSFIPARVMVNSSTVYDKSVEGAVIEMFCEDMRNSRNSPDTPLIQQHRQQFKDSIPSFRNQPKKIGTVVVKDAKGGGLQTRYILTGGDVKYHDDMGSLYNRRSEPWKQKHAGGTAPDPKIQEQLEREAKATRQDSLNAVVREHAYKKELIIHAGLLDPDGATQRDRYKVTGIEFVDNENPGLDFTV